MTQAEIDAMSEVELDELEASLRAAGDDAGARDVSRGYAPGMRPSDEEILRRATERLAQLFK